jgi:HEAT repeat protein
VTTDASSPATSQVEDLVRALVKAVRAHQMYLPNNPMYQRADVALREAFVPVWELVDEVVLVVDETRLVWDDQVVYDVPTKGESFAWGLYQDGMRLLVLRKGVEEGEIAFFLQTVSRARLLPADAPDDLLTLLWGQEFSRIAYVFAEVVTDPWVYDPQAIELEAQPAPVEEVREQVRQEVQAGSPRPQGVVDLEEFDSTLYFLDETEIAELARQVDEEYRRDGRGAALAALFDVFEVESEPAVRAEILSVLELLFPNLLSRGEFRAVAFVLRELRTVVGRVKVVDEETRARVLSFEGRLSEPETIGQLIQSLDGTAQLPPEEDLGEVLGELRAPALGAILGHLPGLSSAEVRAVISAAAERLAAANGAELVGLLDVLAADALPGAIQLAARLNLQAAIPPLGVLIRHLAPEVRLAAVNALGVLGTPGAMTALEPALDDGERTVRGAALAVVLARNYGGALRRLEVAVQGKSPVMLERAEKRQFFEGYAAIAGPSALDLLRSLLLGQGLFRRKATPDTRTCAVYAIGKIRTPEARSLLSQVANDKELPVRHAAASILREWPL